MKKPVAILICCALLAPLAFAQPSSNRDKAGHRFDRSSNSNGNDHQNDD